MPRKRPQWNGTAPPPCGMMNLSVGKVLEQVGQDDLHEHHGVGVEIIRAGGVHRRIAAAGDVDHRRHVELDHLLVERIPPLVGQRRRVEIAAGRIGIEVAADEAHLDAALELGGGVLRRHARRLRQLAHADEILRIERDDARDQVVADLRPFEADALVADVMAHAGGARREDGQVGAALALQLELVLPRCFRGSRRRTFSARRATASRSCPWRWRPRSAPCGSDAGPWARWCSGRGNR